MECGFYGNFDWVTRDIQIGWLYDWGECSDGITYLQGPWWHCIECSGIFYSTTLCMCDNCNPFSGYCRGCHPK